MNNHLAVIIPVYNTEKYLEECLDSVLQQTWKNITVFAIDDGSTDRSAEILELYSKKDSRLRVIRKVNGGVSSARNMALDEIQEDLNKFDFLHFFDSDDILDCSVYKSAIDLLNEYNADFALLPVLQFDKRRIFSKKEQTCRYLLRGQDEIVNFFFQDGMSSSLEKVAKSYNFRALGNKIFRVSFFSQIKFNPVLKTTEDQDLFLRILPNLKSAITVPNNFLYYRLRHSSLSKGKETNGNFQVFSELYFNPLDGYTVRTNSLIFNEYVRALINNLLCSLGTKSQNSKDLVEQAKMVLSQKRFTVSKKMKSKIQKCLIPGLLGFIYIKYRYRKLHIKKQNPYFFD